jgi:hypothetical protein
MLLKRSIALFALVLLTVSGSAQQRPADITVSRAGNIDDPDAGMFRTIQAAVNAARPGQIIEIIDNEVYNEQVTIDGRETSPWPGVVGGKNGITIRSRNASQTNLNRPTIRWQDTQNTSPRNATEAGRGGEMVGQSGNFETCGALRIIRAQDVTIDGIIIDGGGPMPFGWPSVWEGRHPLVHGNAAVTLVVASRAIIRNSSMTNAYIGVNIKDRNTGGVFGNRNPGDNDETIPLSGFGRVGGHLIEYSRIHGNSVGFFFESAWDFGSTVRHNLIYDNFHLATTRTRIGTLPESDNQAASAFVFKDMVYSPVAIYNNTFYNNHAVFIANWQVGAPHLVFNNIFGTPNGALGAQVQYVDAMGIDHRFPNRMNNNVFSAIMELSGRNVHMSACQDPAQGLHGGMEVPGITQVRITNALPNPAAGGASGPCPAPLSHITWTSNEIINPGALMTGTVFSTAANNRWLETSARVRAGAPIIGTENLFVSTNPTSPDFLRPIWDHRHVERFIQNEGWAAIGMRNSDGQFSDLGAIPSTGRAPATVARIRPTDVVRITGSGAATTATARFALTVGEGQVFNNPRIRFIRWVSPIPPGADWGAQAPAVPATSIINITPPAAPVSIGTNNLTFPVPAVGAGMVYGFFELTIEGTDANGNLVTSDVGFLPFRTLTHSFHLEVLPRSTAVNTPLDTVTAGDTVRFRVSARTGTGLFTTPVAEVGYDLLSDATSVMRCVGDCPPNLLGQDLAIPTADRNVAQGRTYLVVFERAGAETIMASGIHGDIVFLGSTSIVVRPGTPHDISFRSPIPARLIPPDALPPVINMGEDRPILVEVRDRFGNAIDRATSVSIVSDNVEIADVGTTPATMGVKTVMTDPATGIATFNARVTNGRTGDTFTMTATLAANGATDQGRLRIGRVQDALMVLYSDTGTTPDWTRAWQSVYDASVTINSMVGQWERITVIAASRNPDTVIARTGSICVEATPGLVLSATPGGPSATVFPISGGVATFYVGAEGGAAGGVTNGCLDVSMLRTPNCNDVDFSINPGNRCDIEFMVPSTSILSAVVRGDGHGRPETVIINYASEGGAGGFATGDLVLPDSVKLLWPTLSATGVVVPRSQIAIVDAFTLSVTFDPMRFPAGHTAISGAGVGLVTTFGGSGGPTAVDDMFDVLDGIGPIIASSMDGTGRMSPMIIENNHPGVAQDTLILQFTETILDELVLRPSGLFTTSDPNPNGNPAVVARQLNILEAQIIVVGGEERIQVVLAPGLAPADGDWIRVNSASGLEDVASLGAREIHNHPNNTVQANNRWVQVIERPTPPEFESAYYTADVRTGILNYAYITLNKGVDIATVFSGGHFRFSLGAGMTDSVVVGANPYQFLSVVDGDVRTLRVDLSVAFPSTQNRVITSGGMDVNIGFNPMLGWDRLVGLPVTDRAAPVLVESVILAIGSVNDEGVAMPDTLVVIYSETIPDATARGIDQPVRILSSSGNPTVTPVLRFDSRAAVGDFMRVRYVIEDLPGTFPTTGDSVFINSDVGLGDDIVPPNIQASEDNRRVPLVVERGAINWVVTVRNNPFSATGGRDMRITLTPNAKGARVGITSKIRLYNAMGNLVLSEDRHNNDGRDGNEIEWDWDGRNRHGRLVGTGTYLLKIVSDATIYGSDNVTVEGRGRHQVTRSVGFVR